MINVPKFLEKSESGHDNRNIVRSAVEFLQVTTKTQGLIFKQKKISQAHI